MVQDARNKITFLKMELLRQTRHKAAKNPQPALKHDVCRQCDWAILTVNQAAQAQRRAQLMHKIQVEDAISTASVRMYETAKVLKDKKLIADVKTRMDESKQKLQLLNLALSRLPPGQLYTQIRPMRLLTGTQPRRARIQPR